MPTPTLSPAAPTASARAADWFHVQDLGDGVHLIAEPGHVNTFLVVGSHRALLFDTGTGIAPISDIVRSLTDLPLVVVNSHDHVDHRGGNADLLAHADELDLVGIAAHVAGLGGHGEADPAFLASYAAAMVGVVERYEEYAVLDQQAFYVLPGLARMRPLPDLAGWRVPAVTPSIALADGDVVDLGDRTFRVLHTPGHSPDSLCLFEEATGILLAGDTIIAAASWLHNDGADTGAFAQSCARLADLPLRRILTAHNLLAERPPTYAAQVAHAAAVVHSGHSHGARGTDMLGNPVERHDVGPVTLLLRAAPTAAAPGALRLAPSAGAATTTEDHS